MIKDIIKFFSFLNPNKDWGYFFSPFHLFYNYFWIITITAILHRSIDVGWFGTLVLPIILYSCLFRKPLNIDFNVIDVVWIIMLFWMILTWTYNDYPNQGILIVRCIAGQIGEMMTYWIARNTSKDCISKIIKKAYTPLVITAIVGIYCFFYRPSWYVHIIEAPLYNRVDNVSASQYLEAYRLRSIFPSPYTLAYFSAITLIYEFFILVRGRVRKRNRIYHYALITLLVVTMLLTMMRAPVACALIGFLISIYYGYRYYRISKIFLILLFTTTLTISCIPFILPTMDNSTYMYFQSKVNSVTEDPNSFVERRLFLDKRGTELLGDGVGRHSMHADKYNPGTSIRDGEYMKIIQEQGYIGLGIFIIMCSIAIFFCMMNLKSLGFELCIILMLLICMIGANPLSTGDKHPIIYWLALGRISRKAK